MTSDQALLTIGVIAERLGQRVHRIRYVIAARGIQPSSRAGNARVFSELDVERIRMVLRQIDKAKGDIHT